MMKIKVNHFPSIWWALKNHKTIYNSKNISRNIFMEKLEYLLYLWRNSKLFLLKLFPVVIENITHPLLPVNPLDCIHVAVMFFIIIIVLRILYIMDGFHQIEWIWKILTSQSSHAASKNALGDVDFSISVCGKSSALSKLVGACNKEYTSVFCTRFSNDSKIICIKLILNWH